MLCVSWLVNLMIKKITVYLCKDILIYSLSIFSLVTVIISLQQFAYIFSKFNDGNIPLNLTLNVLWYSLPHMWLYIAPLSLFIGIILAYGRMHVDSEFIVWSTSGVGLWNIVKITMFPSVLVAAFTAFLSIYYVPYADNYRDSLLNSNAEKNLIMSLPVGKFQKIFNEQVMFIQGKDKDGFLEGVFLAKINTDTNKFNDVIYSKKAYVEVKPDGSVYLIFLDGQRIGYSSLIFESEGSLSNLSFEEYGRELVFEKTEVNADKTLTTPELIQEGTYGTLGELYSRLSLPISILILSIIAVPLARVNPRAGKFGNLLPGIAIFLLYINSINMLKRYAVSHNANILIPIFLTHMFFLLLGVYLVQRSLRVKS